MLVNDMELMSSPPEVKRHQGEQRRERAQHGILWPEYPPRVHAQVCDPAAKRRECRACEPNHDVKCQVFSLHSYFAPGWHPFTIVTDLVVAKKRWRFISHDASDHAEHQPDFFFSTSGGAHLDHMP